MRVILLVTAIAMGLACGTHAAAQAVGETMQINRQSMQTLGTGKKPGFPAGMSGTQDAGQVVIQDADAPRPLPVCNCASLPVFSVSGGPVMTGAQVTITGGAKDAVLYYTTDGWTPTTASSRYNGPVTITADTRLRAIALEPNKLPSAIAEANFTVNGPVPPQAQDVQATGGVLPKGTAVRLVTNADVASDEAQVGDRMPLLLDENLMDGGAIVIPKGSAVVATLTRVELAGANGRPGVLVFQVQAIQAHGLTIPLAATLTLAAPDPSAQQQHIENPALVHVAGALPHGEEAEITPGMTLTAYVSADTALQH